MAKKDKITIDVDVDVRTVQSVRKEIKDLTSELLNLEQGSEEWNKTLIEIGNRKKELQDINNLSRAAAMDMGEALGNITGSLRGVAGGFGAVTGAITLFGGVTSDIAKVQTKLTALIAVVQGLSALENGLSKKLPAVIRLVKSMAAARDVQTKSTKGASAATVANTTSTTANTAATTASTVATNSFSKALNGVKNTLSNIGISTFTLGLGAAVTAMGLLIKKTEDAKKAIDEQRISLGLFNNTIRDTNAAIKGLQFDFGLETQVDIFKETGKGLDTFISMTDNSFNKLIGNFSTLRLNFNQWKKDVESGTESYKEYSTRTIKELQEVINKANDSLNNDKIKGEERADLERNKKYAEETIKFINLTTKAQIERKKYLEDLDKEEDKRNKERKDANDKLLKEQNDANNKYVSDLIKNYNSTIKYIDQLIVYEDGYKGEIQQITDKYEKQNSELEKQISLNAQILNILQPVIKTYGLWNDELNALNITFDEFGNVTNESMVLLNNTAAQYNISVDSLIELVKKYNTETQNSIKLQESKINSTKNEAIEISKINKKYEEQIKDLKDIRSEYAVFNEDTGVWDIKFDVKYDTSTLDGLNAALNKVREDGERAKEEVKKIQDEIKNEMAKGSGADKGELVKLNEDLNKQLTLQKEYAEQELELEKEVTVKKQEEQQKRLDTALNVANAIGDITSQVAGYYKEQADAAMEAGDEKAAKKNLDTYKKLETASTIISGLTGAVAAVETFMKNPGGIPGAILGGIQAASILANSAMTVKKIQATKLGSKSVSGSESGASATMNTKSFEESVTNSGYSIQAKNNYALEELRDGVSDQRVYVVESDITNMQNKVSVKEDTGTL